MAQEIERADLRVGVVKNVHVHPSADLDRNKAAERALVAHSINLLDLRVWDSVEHVLPSSGPLTSGSVESEVVAASFTWEPTVADTVFFVATRAYRVLAITARVEVAGTDGGAVTAEIRKAASGTDIAAGTLLHTGNINLKGTVDTNQSLSLSATSSALDIPAGTAIGFDLTGTPTSARGTVTVHLAPAASADDLMLFTGTFASAGSRVKTGDVKAGGTTTKRARFLAVLPNNYDDQNSGQVQLRALAGAETTVADTSMLIDFEACRIIKTDGTVSADLVTTSAASINSLTLANKDFDLTTTGFAPGDVLDCRVTITTVDAASGAAVIGSIANIELRCDVRP